MILQEAVNSGKEFKLAHTNSGWIKIENNQLLWVGYPGWRVALTKSEIISDKWEVKEEEEWFEGGFEAKYPKGVLCRVGNTCNFRAPGIIIDYVKGNSHPFISPFDNHWRYAEPIPLEEAPTIIGKEEVNDENMGVVTDE